MVCFTGPETVGEIPLCRRCCLRKEEVDHGKCLDFAFLLYSISPVPPTGPLCLKPADLGAASEVGSLYGREQIRAEREEPM